MNEKAYKEEGIYEYVFVDKSLSVQLCPLCKKEIGIMPGGRDAVCHNCGYKDPCCE